MKFIICVLLSLYSAHQIAQALSLPGGLPQDDRCPEPTIGTCSFCPSSGCPEGLICCFNGCGTSCMKPVDPTPPCPKGVPLVKCFARPCDVTRCPAHTDATCTDNFCGGCNAVFTDSAGNVLSREQCDANGLPRDDRCPPEPEIGTCSFCPSPGCPEDLICCPNGCGTSCMIPVDPAPPCPEGVPLVKCFARPCDVTRCPAYPDATCTDNYCGGCNAVFTDSAGNVLSREQCDATCPSLTNATNQVKIKCSNENYVNSDCEAFCPEGTELIGAKTAVCLPNGEWTNSLQNTYCQKKCLKWLPTYYCLANPCRWAECPFFPDAICVRNNCGGCNYNFYLNEQELSFAECHQIRG